MNDVDFWNLWNWNKEEAPFFGELIMYPEKSNIFVEREELIDRAFDQLERQNAMGDSSITIICGSPGVGKSTFIDQLLRRKYPDTSERISLIGYVGNPFENNSRLTTTHLLDIFSKVEGFLNKILKGKQTTAPRSDIKSKFTEFVSSNPKNDEFSTLCDIITDTIIPKCTEIHKLRGKIDHYYLAIDDVDYLLASEQQRLLSILCAMAGETSNPSILYTARPLAAGIAKHRVTSLAHHRFTEPIRIPAINPNKVIHARITLNGELDKVINPFKREQTRQFLTKLGNGNIRLVLEYVKKAQQNACKYLKPNNLYFSKLDMLELLYGAPVINKDGLSLMSYLGEQRDLLNVFCVVENGDPIPALYVALLTVDRATNKRIDTAFCNSFNKIAYELNPKGMEQKSFSKNQILESLRSLHRAHLIRRNGFTVSVDKYLSGERNDKTFNPIKLTYIDLTIRGDEILQLTREPKYQELCGLQFLRRDLQDKIKNMKFVHASQLDGSYLLENNPLD